MRAPTRGRPPVLRLVISSILAGWSTNAVADLAQCAAGSSVANPAGGINVTAPPATLTVTNLSAPIKPVATVPGICFTSSGSLDLALTSGSSVQNLAIETNAAPGIQVLNVGTPVAAVWNTLLGRYVPASGASGGTTRIDSDSNITTTGANAHGIVAQSSTTGYPDYVITGLQNFSPAGISFLVTAVGGPNDTPGTVGSPVSGQVLVLDDKGVEIGLAGAAGRFQVNANGTVTFDPGSAFGDLAVGTSRTVQATVTLDGYRGATLAQRGITGTLYAKVTMTASGPQWVLGADFSLFGESSKPQSEGLVIPDLTNYVAGLLSTAQAAGAAGNSVTVASHSGSIVTNGVASHGVYAQSIGSAGAAGRPGGGFFTFGLSPPGDAGSGHAGGSVSVTVDGRITTTYQGPSDDPSLASRGVFAYSVGGVGGAGADGGTYYSGKSGGNGGNGAQVSVYGGATISTRGDHATGILALSGGGDGGDGGEGHFVSNGGRGGAGGRGGTVQVAGDWAVTTQGDSAYGIWAKSVGGDAGAGGSSGWAYGTPGGGGQATDGGSVTLTSGGAVTTRGTAAYALFAQSIGGFGGNGGASGSIFKGRGGSAESAGSGGDVTVTNLASGVVRTSGDESHAILAQSIGGGGGAGGGAKALNALGGLGAAGGDGGIVTVLNEGLIRTHGEDALGIYAQSIGGAGGDGGSATGIKAIGGGASGKSDGNDVTVTNGGAVTTYGGSSTAIFAQSIGGGGGRGGSSSGWSSVGGQGGGGGNAGRVTITNTGTKLATAGAGATAIFAQSVGGGGGAGGNSVAVGAFNALAIGGQGGEGGTGADVTVQSLAGTIVTGGSGSYGIFAQSIGGGGGNGGFAVAASAGLGVDVSIAVGGKAAGGNTAGAVTVVNASYIRTQGSDATAAFAESVGGGGGVGGFALSGAASDGIAISLAFGGRGGTGGAGQPVDVHNLGWIQTGGDRSAGVQAQSVGGGGGNGGFSIAGSGAALGALSLGIGGKGASGGDAGAVGLENSGRVATLGVDADGLIAQSIGGGGGNGGFSIAAAGAGGGAIGLGIGGSADTGTPSGRGGTVTLQNSGAITTAGNRSIGLFAQSVGGGGGSGGFGLSGAGAGLGAATVGVGGSGQSGGDADVVTVTNTGAITTRGDDAGALLAQSVGGGGGSGAFAVAGSGAGVGAASVGIGGSAAGGGTAAAVTVTNTAALATAGERSTALLAQSVGGGGGSGGFGATAAGAGVGALGLGIGGKGGVGGNASTVAVTNGAQLLTRGDDAFGLLAQSVGGGGGNGGFAAAASGAGIGDVNLGIGGGGGTGGFGNQVTVTSAGAILTLGDRATGLFAQSVGGGGGSGGFSLSAGGAGTGALTFGLGGSGAGGGAAGVVDVTSDGTVLTQGAAASGIVAQSVGGGGGNGGFSLAGSGAGTASGTISIGGGAAGGGAGAAVSVRACTRVAGGCGGNLDGTPWTIETSGAGARGIFAQSVGGGGGNGAFSIAGSGAGTASGTFALGGYGGKGGAGSTVLVDSAASILTTGAAADGILAQSVGGGGGNGGFSIAGSGAGTASGTVNVGGHGGDGGAGNSVAVNVRAGVIATQGTDSTGVLAQSVGGGGGNGSFSIAGTGAGTAAGTLSVGGYGGTAGDGAAVIVTSGAQVQTAGNDAVGILAQSVGGGGGRGGFTIAGSGAGKGAGTLGIGGSGGTAGAGSAVSVTANSGSIATQGFASTGIVAQSIGGGGGSGGFSIAGTGAGTGAGTLGIGGFGAGGGNGARVDVTSGIDIVTLGPSAIGIFAQSVGGGGGNGAFSIAGSGAGKGAGTLGIGGSGDTGGDAGEVHVTTTAGTIATVGDRSTAVLAQSLGGGGGNGGFSFAGSFAEETAQFSVAVGGSGAKGGLGRDVTVSNGAVLETIGADSAGIFAQSVGGGGGNGGAATTLGLSVGDSKFNASVAVGGSGGKGNVGGQVTVVNAQRITTTGGDADGIVAQSLGGGGGSGGSSLALNLGLVTAEKPASSVTADLSIGGHGGEGNVGGAASVTNDGTIVTFGDHSRGIFAQSVGGGGGEGGSSRALALSFEKPNPGEETTATDFELKLSIGGNAGVGDHGGIINVINRGDILTAGGESSGIFAQSVGGGGGAGGDGFSGVNNKIVDSIVLLKEIKDFFSPTNLSITVGGNGGNSGDGAAVTVSSAGTIRTLGLASHGILAQSVGGGGGIAEITGVAENEKVGEGGNAEIGIAGKVGIGGAGGSAGNGGAVQVVAQGTIDTSGDDAHAIFAQSVGGGGGVAGEVERGPPKLVELPPAFKFGLGLAFGRDGGGGGNGGDVNVTANGTLITRGAGSNGIFAQSVGGGGGEAGGVGYGLQNLLPIQFVGSVGAAGSGGGVTVVQGGTITTMGPQANGIFAQSAGGEGTGGAVSITVNGAVTAIGEGSHGVFAQSTGGAGAGEVAIAVNGTVVGGTGSIQEFGEDDTARAVAASGVRVEGGGENSLINHGTVTSIDGTSGMAISASDGTLAIVNFGTIEGSVDLGEGASSFRNEKGAMLNTGATFAVGTGGEFTNDGTLSPGGASTVLRTTVAGNLQQSASGTYLVNLDFGAKAADRIDVTGTTTIGGELTVRTLNPGQLIPGGHTVVVLSSAAGVTDEGLGLVAPISAVVRYGLAFPDAQDLALNYLVDFAPLGLNRNQTAIGQHLNTIGLAGAPADFAPVFAALGLIADVPGLGHAYDRLSPEPYLAAETATLFSSRAFTEALEGCGRSDGPVRFATDATCGWFGVSRAEVRQGSTADNLGFTRTSNLVSGGAQGSVADGSWHVGVGFSFEDASTNADGLASSSGKQVQLGAVLRKDWGATSLAADVAAGTGSYDNYRQVGLPTPGVTARGHQDVNFVAADLRLTRAVVRRANWYLRPMLDLGVTGIRLPGFDEQGAGVLSLRVAREEDTFTHLTPMLEVGGEERLATGLILRPYARAGVTWLLGGASPELHASFQGAPAGVARFAVTGALDQTYADVEAGLALVFKKGGTLRIGYTGAFADQLRVQSGLLEVSVQF